MTENIFIKKIKVIYDKLISNYYEGEEIDLDIKAFELLCHNFLYLYNKEKKKTDNGQRSKV